MIKKINKNKNKNQMTKHKRILFVLSVVLLILFSIIITFLSTIYFVEAVNETIEMQKAFDLQKMESQKNLELQLEMNYLSSSMYGKGQEINSILSTNNFDSSIFDGYDYSRFIYGSIPEDNDGAGFIDLPKNAKKIYMRKSSDNIKYNKSDLIKVKNSKGNETIAEMIFYESDLREDFSLKTSKNQISDGQIVDAEVVLPGRFNSFQLRELKFNKNKSLKIEDLAHESISILGKNEIKAYAMNLDELNFTTGKYYDFAEGRELWKCKDWNFTLQQCFGSWVKIMDLIPGTEYSFDISPVDPAYVEVFDLNNAIDVDIVALDSENLVLAWVDGDVNNYVSFEIWNTRGIRAVDEVNVDTSGDNGDAVAVSSVNSSHFVVGWVDGPLDDLRHAGFVVDGSSYFASVALDTNIGTFSDVDVCSLGDRYAVVDANQNDADADFRIQSNSGASLVIETAADGTISPAANNQNLVSCSLFNSSVWVYAFFDDFDKDASVFVRSMTGVAVGAQLDIDTNVGETGQVAVAGLRGNRYAYVFYNSVNSSVYMTVRGLSGTTHTTVLGNTVIDSNAGTSSRVSVAEVEFSNQSYFAAAWFDQSDTTIKVGVYNGSGAQITAPFIITSTPTASYPIVSVAGTNSLLGYGLCNATFAIAYTNSSGNAVFETYWYNGTIWDGACPGFGDNVAPTIEILGPENNTLNTTSLTIDFFYNVTDESAFVNCSLYINEEIAQTNNLVSQGVVENFSVDLTNGIYSWKIGCSDLLGNSNMSAIYNLNISVLFYSSGAIDIDIDSLDLETLVMSWVDGDVNNYVSFEVWNTNISRVVNRVDVDTSGDNGDAVAVSSVNSSHFVVGWVDGPLDDLRHAGFVVDGSSYFASVALDTNIGTFSDVDVCSLGDRYAVVDANQNDADADFRIQSNSGASLVIETAADGTISPAANNQNLVSCSLFNSSVWVYAFFDDFDKDASVFVRSMTGVAVGAQLDIDTNVGETGQVAVAGLRGNRYAYVFYNSVNSSVYMTVRGLSGTTHTTVLGNTVIDSNAGTSSRVSVAEVEFSNQSYFAAAWFDQSDTTIKVGVYNGSGAQITAPFIVSSAPTVTFPIVSVTGTHSNLGYGLCNATFAIAYTNSSGNIVFRTYWYNGTTWNGTCPDYDPPVINIISPINNTVNKTNSIINFYYDVSDRSVVSSCSLYIDDVLNQTIYSVVKDSTINFTANLSNENYTWKIGCIDSSGNVANSSMNNLNVSWYMPIIQSLTSNSFIILNPGSTKNVECNASIYEGNGISDISIVNATFFRSNTSINGPLNNNTLYVNSSCTSISSSGNISNYTCSFQVYYYALNGSWNCTVNAFDVDDFSGTNTTNLTIDTLYALNLSNLLIDYGNISPGSNSSDKNINITNLGNMNLNITVKGYGGDDPVTGEGYAMRCVSGDNILIENHRYSTISGKSFNQKIPLTSSPVHLNLTIQKQTQPNAIMINSSYWQLNVPPMPSVTQCNGTIVFTVAAPY
ncbi:MAG: hypothetical protein WC758_04620 [Candidatus Woesearchaeota archaeon]|jgi:hypothetical protein